MGRLSTKGKPLSGDSTITHDGSDYVVAEVVVEITVTPLAIELVSFTEIEGSSYPPCPWPGYQVEIDGVTWEPCWAEADLEPPAVGSSDPMYLPSIRAGDEFFFWIGPICSRAGRPGCTSSTRPSRTATVTCSTRDG